MDLAKKKCLPCEDLTTKPLTQSQAEIYLKNISGWILSPDAKKIAKEFKFKDFVQALNFVNKVGEIAEAEGHHPDIHIFYNNVTLELWTHAINGLHENDFIVASKVDGIL